jgi:Na+/H+ antiporter NhaD/arsenite permease-like protein
LQADATKAPRHHESGELTILIAFSAFTDCSSPMTAEHTSHSTAYKAVALLIFGLVAFTFIFPSSPLVPFDRKTIAAFGATLCYITRAFVFRGDFDIIGAVDFNVLVLLASIMVINHVIVHLPEVKALIRRVQATVSAQPVRGFWLISFTTFVVAPFLTNDGVCLLFVEIIISAFDEEHQGSIDSDGDDIVALPSASSTSNAGTGVARAPMKLDRKDVPYFLLVLACSSNIGSALTYTGINAPTPSYLVVLLTLPSWVAGSVQAIRRT